MAPIRAATAAVLWLSNLYFAFSDVDYFGPSAESNLFLHTWSLGVEEQFYLFWPLLLLAVAASRRTGNPLDRWRAAMTAVFVLGLVLCIGLSLSSPRMAFYLMPTRAWQFALGAAIWLAQSDQRAFPRSLAVHAGWLGLAAVLGSALAFDQQSAYPGWRALLPTLGAGLLIIAGVQAGHGQVRKLLESRPMQAMGRVSYGWYLWHWPLLLLAEVLVPEATLGHRVFLVAAAWALATLSFHGLEKPVRTSLPLLARPTHVVIGALALMAVAVVSFGQWQKATVRWLDEEKTSNRYLAAKRDVPEIYALGCDDWYHSANLEICRFGASTGKVAVMIGDSIGLQWFPAVKTMLEGQGWQLLVMTKSSCPMVDAPVFYERIGRDYTECAEWRRHALAAIRNIKPDIVILGSSANYGFDDALWIEGSKRVMAQLSPATGAIYVIRATPLLPFPGPACLARTMGAADAASRCAASAINERHDQVWNNLMTAARSFANVKGVDMNDAVCPGRVCQAERDGVVVFRDAQHLTASYVNSISAGLAANIALPPHETGR